MVSQHQLSFVQALHVRLDAVWLNEEIGGPLARGGEIRIWYVLHIVWCLRHLSAERDWWILGSVDADFYSRLLQAAGHISCGNTYIIIIYCMTSELQTTVMAGL